MVEEKQGRGRTNMLARDGLLPIEVVDDDLLEILVLSGHLFRNLHF